MNDAFYRIFLQEKRVMPGETAQSHQRHGQKNVTAPTIFKSKGNHHKIPMEGEEEKASVFRRRKTR
jgi:hypothetical protein